MKPSRTVLTIAGSMAFVLLALWAAFRIECARQGEVADAKRTYARELAALQQAGLPIHMRDLKSPQPPPDQNAAPLYVDLARRLKAHPLSKQEQVVDVVARRFLSTPDEMDSAEIVLKTRADLMMLMHRAAEREGCVFDRNLQARNPASITFPELASMRQGVRMLNTESILLAWHGKPLEAVRNQALGFRTARHAAGDGIMISYLVCCALDAITLAGMEKILYLSHGDPAVAREVRRSIDNECSRVSLAKALRSEVAVEIGLVEYLRKYGTTGIMNDKEDQDYAKMLAENIPSSLPRDPSAWNAYLDRNGAIIANRQHRILAIVDRPYLEVSHRVHEMEAEVEGDTDPAHSLSAALFPIYADVIDKSARILAQRNVVYTACAILEWKATHGDFPPTLESVLTPLPIDPHDGKPLRYRREGAGFVVYSAGKAGALTGGSPDRKPGKDDVLFRYPVPSYYLPTAPR